MILAASLGKHKTIEGEKWVMWDGWEGINVESVRTRTVLNASVKNQGHFIAFNPCHLTVNELYKSTLRPSSH